MASARKHRRRPGPVYHCKWSALADRGWHRLLPRSSRSLHHGIVIAQIGLGWLRCWRRSCGARRRDRHRCWRRLAQGLLCLRIQLARDLETTANLKPTDRCTRVGIFFPGDFAIIKTLILQKLLRVCDRLISASGRNCDDNEQQTEPEDLWVHLLVGRRRLLVIRFLRSSHGQRGSALPQCVAVMQNSVRDRTGQLLPVIGIG